MEVLMARFDLTDEEWSDIASLQKLQANKHQKKG